ncbi:MAG: ABC transporter permease [Luteimonas sp.]
MARSLWRHRNLIGQMTRREVVGRYKGSVMGLAWSFLNPLLMLVIYTFVFRVIFKARWETAGNESNVDFAVVLFVGMIVHSLFAECVNRAPGLIIANVNYVKKVVFPLEILPAIALGSALFHAATSMLVLLAAVLATTGALHPHVLLAPVLILPIAAFALGIAWFLASLGVFLRDVGQITGILTTALLFLSPVFYPLSAMPEKYRGLIQVNPLTIAIEQTRGAVIWGRNPDWGVFAIYLAAGLLTAWAGFWWFQRTRRGFADVL